MDELIEKANDRLKAANTGLKIFRRGAKLSLRGTLPPKPGNKGKSQQTIALDVYANPAGIKRAFAEAKIIAGLVALDRFDWKDYSKGTVEPATVGEWIDRFEKNYFARRVRSPKSETTWHVEYETVFGKLPLDAKLTDGVLLAAILVTEPDTRTRKRFCMVANQLARFASVELDATPYAGSYSPSKVSPRDLPSDDEIIAMRESIDNPQWRYAFGLMATYGLRNHEVFNLDLESLKTSSGPGVLAVLDGKTGSRRVWPFRLDWWSEWSLWSGELPQVRGKNNSDLGSRVTKAFKRLGLCKPYDLRHAWAVRTLEMGLDVSLSAAQMGHSVTIHTSVYHHWISDRVHQKAFEAINYRFLKAPPPLD